MRPRIIATALAAAALAAGGTALASVGGSIHRGGPFHEDVQAHEADLAKDLAAHLDGVTASEIQRALEKVREQRTAEHRAELARALAPRLDGVTVAQVERALEKAEQQETGGRGHGPGGHDALVRTLAGELDRTEADVREALAGAMRARMEAHLDEAVKAGRLTKAQADAIRERMSRGGPHDRFEHRPGPEGPTPAVEPAPF